MRGRLLRPGTHVDLIGGYNPAMCEADEDTVRRGRVFVDTRDDMRWTGDIAQPLDQGVLREPDIQRDLFDMCSGSAPGRTVPDAVTAFKNVGGPHLDLFAARYLLEMVEGRSGPP